MVAIEQKSVSVLVRRAGPNEKSFIARTLLDSWGGTWAAAHGELIDASALPALVAVIGNEPVGLLTYLPRPGDTGPSWEIVTLDSVRPGQGVGTALLDSVRTAARHAGVSRLWLITTNDNTHALRFYQRYGFDLVAMHRNAVTASRRLKPEIPLTADGIPIAHELELELPLRSGD